MILLAVSSFLSYYTHIKIIDLMPQSARAEMNSFEKFSTKYPKLMLVILIPIYSFFSSVWFRKAKLNFTEHLVLNAYKTAAGLVVGILFSVLTIFYFNVKGLILIYYFFIMFGTLLYDIWFYSQFFSGNVYSKKSLVFRSIMVPLSYVLVSAVIGFVLGMTKALR